MSQRKAKRKSRSDLLWAVPKAAEGLYGEVLGFGSFIRKLPDVVLQSVLHVNSLLPLIALHAKAIVDGNPRGEVPEEFFTPEVLRRIRFCLIAEHFRRLAILRVRYPRDPFTDVPEIAWWLEHPYVQVLRTLPDADREKLENVLMQTGDATVLAGHMLLLPKTEQARLMDKAEEIQKQLPEMLLGLEQQYADSRTLAWSESAGHA